MGLFGVIFGTVLTAIGFGTAGPVGGSCAAFVQSCIGNVAAGSTFSFFQWLGMVLVWSL